MDRPSIWARYTEKAVYLKFWATWCVPCIKQMPHFEQIFQNAGPGLAVIAFNAGFNDTPADVREFQKKHGIAMPMVIDDGQLGETFNLRVTPLHVIIARDGRIQYVGHFADERLENALAVARTSAAMVSGSASAKKDAPHYKVGDSVASLSAVTVDGSPIQSSRARGAAPDGARLSLALVRVVLIYEPSDAWRCSWHCRRACRLSTSRHCGH